MRLYELITFTLRVRTPAEALKRLRETLAEARDGCVLMGCWASEIGPLNQVAVLRGFRDETARQVERERFLQAPDAFGIEAFAVERGLPHRAFPDLGTALRALRQGDVSAVLSSRDWVAGRAAADPGLSMGGEIVISAGGAAMALRPADRMLRVALSRAIEALEADGTLPAIRRTRSSD